MKLTFKYPVYPTRTQEQTLSAWLDHLCELQNSARHDRKVALEVEDRFVPADIESAIRAFRGSIGQFIFCSTVDVYAKPAQHYPIREDAAREPMPSFPYAYNKAKCERRLENEPEVYSEIIERWQHLSRKETFFGKTDRARQ